jgi:hypothetical protein
MSMRREALVSSGIGYLRKKERKKKRKKTNTKKTMQRHERVIH